MLQAIVSFALIFITTFLILRKFLSPKLPPGPWGLPLVGYAPYLGAKPQEAYGKLAKKYGSIFTVSLFSQNWIILNSRELIEEAFLKQGKATSGRPPNPVLDTSGGKAIPFIHGHLWKTQREFEMRTFKLFGKEAMEDRILNEFEHLKKLIEGKNGEPCECQVMIAKAVVNITLGVTIGLRFPYEDERFESFATIAGFNVSGAEDSEHFGLLIAMPFLRYIPPFKRSFQTMVQAEHEALGEMRKLVAKRKESNENSVVNYVDRFLREINREGSDDSFNEIQLENSLVNLLVASSDTTTNTLRWSILALLNYPDYQDRLAKEILDMAERRGEVSLKRQEDLSLTRAFVYEIWRYCTLLPLALPHMALSEVRLQGYRIPKGTPIVANFWAVHRDPKIFQNPDEFHPERFIDADGTFVPNTNVTPFSVGSRRCIGEQLGRIEPILILAKLIENFRILPCSNAPVPSMNDGVLAISYSPKEFRARFHKREKTAS